MYAVGHTTLTLISLSDSAIERVKLKIQKHNKSFTSGACYRTTIKGEVWSFFYDYKEAKGFQVLLNLDGKNS